MASGQLPAEWKDGRTHMDGGRVWEILCDCIVGALGVKREEVTRDARLIEDLGMN